MVYYDNELEYDIDEELLIKYITKRNLIEPSSKIKSAEIHGTIIPFDTATTYIIRVHYENKKYGVLAEGFVDIDVCRFNKYLRKRKISNIINKI
mgnify:CR=1 FL=1